MRKEREGRGGERGDRGERGQERGGGEGERGEREREREREEILQTLETPSCCCIGTDVGMPYAFHLLRFPLRVKVLQVTWQEEKE